MAKRIEVRSQIEFDACVRAGNVAIVIGCSVEAWGNSSVVAWENSRAVARENSRVVARENSSVEAWGNSSVEARENSRVVARENSSVEAWGNSSVVAWENSRVEAWGNSRVEAWENSSVEARGLVFVRWFSCLKIKASAQVIIAKMGNATGVIKGGRQIKCTGPKTIEEWCGYYGVEVRKGVATLFKAVDADYSTENARNAGISYIPGGTPVAPDWDGGKEECGGGLHFSPSPAMALEFNPDAKKFVACPVRLKDLCIHPDGTYPQKVKGKGCWAPVYEVDRNGNRIG